jgi:dynein heavy chain
VDIRTKGGGITCWNAGIVVAYRVTMVLERSQHVELRPTIQQLFDMTQKVSRALITVVQMVPRLALQVTPRQLKELEVSES